MATFKALALEHHVKSNGTVRLKILITHNKKKRYLDSGLVANASDLTKEFEIKTRSFKNKLHDTIEGYRDQCNLYPEKVAQMTCDELVRFLTKPEASPDLDFISFADTQILKMIESGRLKSARDYQTAINALNRYTGLNILPVKEITVKFLQDFAVWIIQNPKNKGDKYTKVTMSRAPSHYLGSIRTLHNQMKLQYNDEDSGTILIPGSPFDRFKIPKRQQTKKRSISPEMVKAIYQMKDEEIKNSTGYSRLNIAKDCFILSFCLMGMNSADLYDCKPFTKSQIRYMRKKTRNRRSDKAEIIIDIPPEIKSLMEKYKDPDKQRQFNFYRLYTNESGFNKSLNKGLKLIAPDLEFYAARHTFASIGLNKVGIDKYLIHEMLNHVDESMRVTDVYLEKDWSRINNANRLILDFVFKEKPDPVKSPA